MPKTPSCGRFASRERFDWFSLGAEPVFHSNTSARRSTGRCTSSPIFLQNTRGTAAFLPEGLAWCRFGSEGRFEVLFLGTLPVFLRESFGQRNVRQSVLGEKCRKRRLAAVSRLASVSTDFGWALSLFFIPTPPREKAPGGAPLLRFFAEHPQHRRISARSAGLVPFWSGWPFRHAIQGRCALVFTRRLRCEIPRGRAPPAKGAKSTVRLRGRCWSDFHRGFAAFSIACSAARRVTSADRLFAQRVVCRRLGCPRQVCRGGLGSRARSA